MEPKKTGRFIAELRKERGMTQKELAKILSVSDKTVSKWETGRGLPEISLMQSLCETFDISINELLTGGRLDNVAYREKAEENITELIKHRSYKKLVIHIAISTVLFLAAFLMFPLAAEKIISPMSIPVVLFWCILLIVCNFIAGVTYGAVKKWRKLSLLLCSVYNIFLLFILISVFVMASIVIFTA